MSPANDQSNSNAVAYFCEGCGSADVTASGLSGGEASCGVCGWRGRVEELATLPFSHDMTSQGEVFHRFFLDIRNLLSKNPEVGALLIKWGFVEFPEPKNMELVKKKLARYLGSMCMSMTKSVIEIRQQLEKERGGEPTPAA